MAKIKSYVVRVTEMNPREAVIKATSKKLALEYAERLWEDNYDNFKDIQDLDHETEVLREAGKTETDYLPVYPDDLEGV